MAQAQADTGDAKGARATVDEALPAARAKLDAESLCHWLLGCGELLAEVKDAGGGKIFDEATAAADRVETDDAKFRLHCCVATAMQRAGDKAGAAKAHERAVAAAARIEDDRNRAWAYFSIADTQSRIKDFAGAKATAARIEDAAVRAITLSSVAKVESKSDAAGAARTWEQAFATASAIADEGVRLNALRTLAAGRGKDGDLDTARKTVTHLKDLIDRVDAWTDVAEARSEAGDRKGCLEALAAAREAAKGVTDPESRVRVCVNIGRLAAEAGDAAEAKAAFAEANLAADTIEKPDSADSKIGDIARAQTDAGDFEGAIKTAARFQLGFETETYCLIAQAQAAKGVAVTVDSLQWFKGADASSRVQVFTSIAQGLAELKRERAQKRD